MHASNPDPCYSLWPYSSILLSTIFETSDCVIATIQLLESLRINSASLFLAVTHLSVSIQLAESPYTPFVKTKINPHEFSVQSNLEGTESFYRLHQLKRPSTRLLSKSMYRSNTSIPP